MTLMEERAPSGKAERKQTPPHVIANRRANKAAARAYKRAKVIAVEQPTRDFTERQQKRRKWVARTLRGIRSGIKDPIQLEFEYWLAVLCGWDFAAKEYREVISAPHIMPKLHCVPLEGKCWLWWIDLAPVQRDAVARASQRQLMEQKDGDDSIGDMMGAVLQKYGIEKDRNYGSARTASLPADSQAVCL